MVTRRERQFIVCSLFLILLHFPLMSQTSAVTSEGYIRDWQQDGDHIAFSTEGGAVRSVMTADEEKLVLRMYDERHRLTSEVVWNNGYESMSSETAWTYADLSVFPATMTRKLYERNQLVKVLYTGNGLEKERTTFQFTGDQTGNQLEKTEWQYDEQRRVICKTHEESGDSSSDAQVSHFEKTVYAYTDFGPDPDTWYYEDDVLVESVEHVSESSHIERLYFDDMEIETTWVDGIKTEEVYYLDGKEFKRKTM